MPPFELCHSDFQGVGQWKLEFSLGALSRCGEGALGSRPTWISREQAFPINRPKWMDPGGLGFGCASFMRMMPI